VCVCVSTPCRQCRQVYQKREGMAKQIEEVSREAQQMKVKMQSLKDMRSHSMKKAQVRAARLAEPRVSSIIVCVCVCVCVCENPLLPRNYECLKPALFLSLCTTVIYYCFLQQMYSL